MSNTINKQSKIGEGERIVTHLNSLGLTFAPSELEENEENSLFSVYHFSDELNNNPTTWVTYKDIIDNKCHPDYALAGKEHKVIVGKTKTTMIVPDVTDGIDHRMFDDRPMGNVHEQTIIGRPKYEFTVLPVKGYTKHLRCSSYIEKVKKQVIGKVVKLRSAIMNAAMFYAPRYRYVPEVYTSQYRFASENMAEVILGLTAFDELPLDVMNTKTILTYIDGVNTLELAEMVMMVATTSSVRVYVRNYPERKNFCIECVFDADSEKTFSFGKGYLKHFDHLVENLDEHGLAPFSIVCSDSEIKMSKIKKRKRSFDVERKCWVDYQDQMNDGYTDQAENEDDSVLMIK